MLLAKFKIVAPDVLYVSSVLNGKVEDVPGE